MDEEEKRMASSGRNSSLLEPKEEPLDDFLLMAGDNKIVTQSAAIIKEEVKEEPLDLVDSYPVKNEISKLVPISSAPVKKESDQYIQDLVGFGLIPAWDATLDQSARYGIPPAVMKKSNKEIKEEDHSSVEQPVELADDFEPLVKKSRPHANAISAGNNSSPKLPVKSKSKEEDGGVVADEANRESDERELQSKSVMKKLARMKNDIELECPEFGCNFRSRFVRVWIRHLKKKHSTTLIQAGLILRCKCGNESQTGAYIVECNSTNDCVVRCDRKMTGDLECPECEFRTKSPCTWIEHLKNEHSTTPKLAGLALLCECGHEALSDSHRTKCPIANFSIIRKRDGPIRRLDDDVTTPQCILCDAHPRTAQKYVSHLRIDHESTLMKNNIALKCACGFEVRTEAALNNGQHSNKCDGHEFTLHTIDVTTPQCVLCEAYPKTAYGYVFHIRDIHKSSLNREGIYLICSCGTMVRTVTNTYNPEHKKECDGRNFSLHKVEDKIHTTPQCILCEAYPGSSYAYPEHLQKQHKSSLAANGLFIRCGCALSVKSANRHPDHGRSGKCNGLEFTLHKLEKKVTEPTAAHLSTSEQEKITISTGSLLEPKEEPIEYSMSVENEISQHLFMVVDNCKKEELVDDEEVSNLPPPSSPVKDEPIVDEYFQEDLVRFGQQ